MEVVRIGFEWVHRTNQIPKTLENAQKHAENTLSKMVQNQSFSPVKATPEPSRRFSVAPMMDWTN
jgi:tRNA-dihydrouridine synthase A